MPSANSVNQNVLASYAAASQRAETRKQETLERIQIPLTAAREALQHAKANDAQLLSITCEKAYQTATRTYEVEYRAAGNTHGQSITRALAELDQRKAEILAERNIRIAEAQARHEQVCTEFGSPHDPSCLPALDAYKLVEVEADAIRDQHLQASHAVYLERKREIDTLYADRVATIERDRRTSQELAKQTYDAAVCALIPPLEAALATAQALYDQELLTANTLDNESRQRRLAIFEGFKNGNSTSSQAVRWLDHME